MILEDSNSFFWLVGTDDTGNLTLTPVGAGPGDTVILSNSGASYEVGLAVDGGGGLPTYAGGTTYDAGDEVMYSSRSYRSLAGSNLGNQPDISPSEWEAFVLFTTSPVSFSPAYPRVLPVNTFFNLAVLSDGTLRTLLRVIPMPTIFGKYLQTIKWTQRVASAMSASPYTYQQQVYKWPGNMWAVQGAFPPMRREDAETVLGFMSLLRGSAGTFIMGDPVYTGPRGSILDEIDLGATFDATNARSETISLKGLTPFASGILLPGDYLQHGSGATQRMYKVIGGDPIDADSGGNADVPVFPTVRSAIDADDAIVSQTAECAWRLPPGFNVEWDVDKAKLFGVAFAAIEAL